MCFNNSFNRVIRRVFLATIPVKSWGETTSCPQGSKMVTGESWHPQRLTPVAPLELLLANLRYVDYTTLMAESEEPKSLLMKVKEESWLKAQHSEN